MEGTSYPLREDEIHDFIRFLKGKELLVIDDPVKPEKYNIFKRADDGSCLLIECGHIDGCLLVLDRIKQDYFRSIVDEYME